jgi:hypothetical protein
MLQSQELEILALSEYRLLDLPAVSRRAQQARELGLARDATADAARSTPFRRLRQALTRASKRQAAPRSTAGRI